MALNKDQILRAVKSIDVMINAEQSKAMREKYEMKRLISDMNNIVTRMSNKVKKDDKPMMPIQEARTEPTTTNFGSLKSQAFLMAFPFNLDNDHPNNPWMKGKELLPVNYDLAYSQWIDLKDIVSAGNLVYVLPSQHDLQDAVYVANIGLMLPQSVRRDTVILSNFRSDPRDHEENVGRGFFSQMEFNVMQSPFFFEGEADIKFLRDNIFIGGHGIRTQPESFDWMIKEFGIQIVKVKMNNPDLYHFDTQCFAIDKENVMLVKEVCDDADIKAVESVANIIDVPLEFGMGGMTNCVRVGNKILSASNLTAMSKDDEKYDVEKRRADWFQNTMTKISLDPVMVNLSEFDKSGASLSCLIMNLSTSWSR